MSISIQKWNSNVFLLFFFNQHWKCASSFGSLFFRFSLIFIAIVAIFSRSRHMQDFPILRSRLYWPKLGFSQKFFCWKDCMLRRTGWNKNKNKMIFIIVNLDAWQNLLISYIDDCINLNLKFWRKQKRK
jgi:hypothetical protein